MPPTAETAPETAAAGPVTFEATAEGGVIAVPPEWRAKLGSRFRVRVTVPAGEPAAPEPDRDPPPAAYPPPELVAAHPDWEWASPEELAKLLPPPLEIGPDTDLGVWEGTVIGELMRNPLPLPEGGFLTREEANTDPHRNRTAVATAEAAHARERAASVRGAGDKRP